MPGSKWERRVLADLHGTRQQLTRDAVGKGAVRDKLSWEVVNAQVIPVFGKGVLEVMVDLQQVTGGSDTEEHGAIGF